MKSFSSVMSMVVTLVGTTLLGFRLESIIVILFATAGILGFIGSNMLYSGYKALKEDASEEDEEEAQQSATTLSYGKLLFQAVATAIDAFAVLLPHLPQKRLL